MQRKRPLLFLMIILMALIIRRNQATTSAGEPDPIVYLPIIVNPHPTTCQITAPPAELGLDPFYTKYCAYHGLPIISSSNVPDAALQQTWIIIDGMLAERLDIVTEMIAQNTRVGIIGQNEVTTDMPEYADLYTQFPGSDWDSYRGLGATPFIPLSSVGEENLLCYGSDPYLGESIMVHEFSHTIKIMGLQFMDANFATTVNDAYQSALNNNLWENTYADDTVEEYWAEGVQSYFDTNLEASPPNGIHNHVNTRTELQAYDPTLYQLIDDVFKGVASPAVCP